MAQPQQQQPVGAPPVAVVAPESPLSQLSAYSATSTRFIGSFVSFCDRCSIDMASDVAAALKTVIVLSMKFIDKRALLELAVPGGYVDWEFVEMNVGGALGPGTGVGGQGVSAADRRKYIGNAMGDVPVWLQLVRFIDFGPLEMNDLLIKKKYPPLWCIYKALKDAGVLMSESVSRSGGGDTAATAGGKRLPPQGGKSAGLMRFDDACKLCILNNVVGLQSRTVMDQYTSAKLGKASISVCTNVVSALADERHESDVYLATMQYLLGIIQIDLTQLHGQIQHYRQTVEARRLTWRLKHMAVRHTRPSMRDVAMRVAGRSDSGSLGIGASAFGDVNSDAQSTLGGASVGNGGGAVGASPISFDYFCDAVRFPNSMSRLLRARCYLICCMEHAFDYRMHTEKLVTKDVSTALNRNSVVMPDVKSVGAAIDTIALAGEPFPELNSFRQRCFVSFNVKNRRNLTMTVALQLYVAAYQKRDIWRQCWKNVYPVMSSQIARDVETFVEATPIAADSFVHILKNSTPFY